jgi:acyl carrier protein
MTENPSSVPPPLEEVERRLKQVVVTHLNLDIDPESIDANEEFFLMNQGFNSIDALELLIVIEGKFGIEINDEDLDARLFRTLRVLAEYILSTQARQNA